MFGLAWRRYTLVLGNSHFWLRITNILLNFLFRTISIPCSFMAYHQFLPLGCTPMYENQVMIFLIFYKYIWPEWISTHQCTSWLFCPSDGWSFSFGSWPYVNQHCTIVSLFWLLAFDPLSWGCFSPILTILYSQPSYSSSLATLLTYILALSINPLPRCLLSFCD